MLRFYLDFTHSRRRVYIDNFEFATCVTFLKVRTSVKAFKKEIKALKNVTKRSRMKYTYENINNTRDQTALEPLLE